jgi:hypothetical protein
MDDVGIYAGWQNRHVLGGDFLAIPGGDAAGEKEAEPGWFDRAIDLIAPGYGARVKSQRARYLIKLLLQKDTQRKLAERLRWVPVRSDACDPLPDKLRGAVDEALKHPIVRPYMDWEQEQRKLSNLMFTLAHAVDESLALHQKENALDGGSQGGDVLNDRQALCHLFCDEAVFDCFVSCLMSRLVDGPGG